MEAGPSAAAAAAVAVGEEREITEEPLEEEEDVGETDVGSFGKFVPPPLVPLQHHLEKDKVFRPPFSLSPISPPFFGLFYALNGVL